MVYNVPLDSITGHFGDESFQAITCTGTDNKKQTHKPNTNNIQSNPVISNFTGPCWFIRYIRTSL